MKKTLLLVIAFLFISSVFFAQRRTGLIGHRRESDFDFFSFLHGKSSYRGLQGKSTGKMYVFGSISPFTAFCMGDVDGWYNGTNIMGAIGFRQIFPNNLGYKAALHFGSYHGIDLNPLTYRQAEYTAKVSEFSLQAEYTIWGGPYSDNSNPNALYAFGGIGILNSAAEAKARGEQLPNSNIIAPFIPIGVGYKYDFNESFSLGAEVGAHIVFNDMVEGYNPLVSGNKFNDVLAFFALTFTYRIYDSGK